MAESGQPLREHPYSGGSRLAVPYPGTESPAPADPEVEPQDEPEQGASEFRRDDYSRSRSTVSTPKPINLGKGPANDGAAVLLGFLVWVWVVLPYLHGANSGGTSAGLKQVRDVLRAKLTNTGPDGNPLP